MKIKDMAQKVRQDADIQDALDDMILDRFSIMASELNNQGPEAQLKWLKKTCKEDLEEISRQLNP
jgi:hypothetical protein